MLAAWLWLGVAMQVPLAANALLNANTFRPLPAAPAGEAFGRVSIGVPARNEAARIGPLLASVLALPAGQNVELLVYDDDSSDGTADMVEAAAAQDARIRLLRGGPLPAGWGGKTHALHHLSCVATGEWLLFVDADVALEPGCLTRAIACMQREGLDILSLYPLQTLGSWGERLFVPCMIYYFHLLGSQGLMRLGVTPSVVALNGQFMLWRRDAYDRLGGYAAIRDAWLDDMTVAKLAVASGLSVAYRPGKGLVRCRMYTGAREAWHGFAKHTWDSFSQPPALYALLHAYLAYALVLVWLAPLTLVWVPWGRAEWLAYAAVIGLSLGTRAISCAQAGNGWTSALLHPLAMAVAIANGAYSYDLARRRSSAWKGRTRGQ